MLWPKNHLCYPMPQLKLAYGQRAVGSAYAYTDVRFI